MCASVRKHAYVSVCVRLDLWRLLEARVVPLDRVEAREAREAHHERAFCGVRDAFFFQFVMAV